MDATTRHRLAEHLRSAAAATAEEVTDRFLALHPDWVTRYGDRARLLGIEDARYHISFLAAALEAGAPNAFREYARWTARVLEARGIARTFVAENLTQVCEALSRRMSADAAPPIREYTNAAVAALADGETAPPDARLTEGLSLTRRMYLQAALAGERRAALTIALEALREGASPIDVYVDVLQAALYEVGRLWEENRISVAHEHAATAITQFVAAHLYERLDRSAVQKRGTLLITGLAGELHSVGALMVADVVETQGWTVHFLGTNLPHNAILDAIRQREPDYVGISATMLFSLPAARRLIEDIRTHWGSSKRILVGGAAFRHAPEAWREIGADGQALDLREALAVLGYQG